MVKLGPKPRSSVSPPAQEPLSLLAPAYDCQTQTLTFRTQGGDGSPIEFSATGITDWTTSPNQRIETNTVNSLNSAPLLLKARQNGQTASYAFNASVYCGDCDFSSGPRNVGTWNGLLVQIRTISGHNVLVTADPNSTTDKYYPRGDNFWGNFTLDSSAIALKSYLNGGITNWWGLSEPAFLRAPSGYKQGIETDGAAFYVQGALPQNPCDVSPRHVGTWNGLNVEIRSFANGKRALITAVPGASNGKYYVRGDNFWDMFTKDVGVGQYRFCLNAGTTAWYGLSLPSGIVPPPGYQPGTAPDGAIYFLLNGLRVAATESVVDESVLVYMQPNPAQDVITVTFILKDAGDVQLRLLDLQGRVQQVRTEKGLVGKNERTLRIGSLSTGLYILEVTLDSRRVILKLLKE